MNQNFHLDNKPPSVIIYFKTLRSQTITLMITFASPGALIVIMTGLQWTISVFWSTMTGIEL